MTKKASRIIAAIIILCSVTALGFVMFRPPTMLTPLSDAPWFGFTEANPHPNPSSAFLVLGYVPFWNLAKVELQPELDALSYFSLHIAGDGRVKTKDSDGNADPGYHRLGSEQWLSLMAKANQNQTRLELTFTQLENEAIESFLASPDATTTFIQELDAALLAYPFTAVHLDVEYIGSPSAELRNTFTSFVKSVDAHLADRYSEMPLRLAIYAGAAEKYQLWDLPALEPHVDSFIIMAYDFHRAGSPIAGPVAPIYGHDELWEGDVSHYLASLLGQIPPQKILLGIPFYGYEWQTTTASPLSKTFPGTGSTASFDRIQELFTSSTWPITQGWDDQALSPYLTLTNTTTNRHYVIYYENAQSIYYKLQLAQQLNLGGIAIWALGYEGSHRELWQSISEFVSQPVN